MGCSREGHHNWWIQSGTYMRQVCDIAGMVDVPSMTGGHRSGAVRPMIAERRSGRHSLPHRLCFVDRHPPRFRSFDLQHAHGLGPGDRRATQKRHSLLRRRGCNTFPIPPACRTPGTRTRLGVLAQEVLDIRKRWPDATLSNLYDPDFMPPDLLSAHQTLDRAADGMYSAVPFTTDSKRLRCFLRLYEQLTNPLFP